MKSQIPISNGWNPQIIGCGSLPYKCSIFNELQDKYPWLLETDFTATTNDDTESYRTRPMIKLFEVNLGSRLWQINGLDVQILNSTLKNLTLKCTNSLSPMKSEEDPRNLSNVEIRNSSVLLLQAESVNVKLRQSTVQNMTIRGDLNNFGNLHRNGENLTSVDIVNSTVQYFHGRRIHLEMSECFITVNTHPPLSPMYVIKKSTAKITNCVFHGDRNPSGLSARDVSTRGPWWATDWERCLSYGNIQNTTSVLFAFQSSSITIRQSRFEAIYVDMSYDRFTSCIHAVGSQITMLNTKVKDNYGYSVINAYETLMNVTDSEFSRNIPWCSVIIGRHARNILLNGAIFEGNDACNGTLHIKNTTINVKSTIFRKNTAVNGGSIYAKWSSTVSVENTTFTYNSAIYNGGAVWARDSTVTVENTAFNGFNGADMGGAVYAVWSAVTVKDTTFTSQRATRGGAVSAVSSTVIVEHTAFTSNSAYLGGAVCAWSSTVTVEYTTFTSNSARSSGGGVYAESSRVTVGNITFTNNSADSGGGGAVYADHTVTVENTTFTNNSAKWGGAVGAVRSTVTVENTIFTSNSAEVGGAVGANDDSPVATVLVTVEKTTFTENTATKATGGAIHVRGYLNITMDRITFKHNHAKDKGGALFVKNNKLIIMINTSFSMNSGLAGGAFYVEDINDMTVMDSKFINNTVDTGKHNVESRNGGALYTGGFGALNLSNVNFTGNQGIDKGGALYVGQQVRVTVKKSLFQKNEVDHGGAIFLGGHTKLAVTHTVFISNHAYVAGGSIYLTENTRITAHHVNLSGNKANETRGKGGALFAGGTSSAKLYNSRFRENVCTLEGGAIYGEDSANILLQDTTLTENNAGENEHPYNIEKNSCGGAMSGSGNSTIHLSGIILLKNRATKGGGICGKDNVKFSITNTTFQNNTAQKVGGAIHVRDQSLLTINKALYTGNIAEHDFGGLFCDHDSSRKYYFGGGAIHVESNANTHISHAEFTDNVAKYHYDDACSDPNQSFPQWILDGHLHADGGAIFISSRGNIVINDTRFSNNQAKSNGGSISVNGTAEIILTNTHFTNNSGGSKGAAVYAQESANVYFHGSDFSNNLASTDAALYMSDIETIHTVNCMLHCTSMKPCLHLNGHDEYLHSHTRLVSQNTILSSFSKNFMDQAEEKGLIVIDETSNVTEKESVYASGKDTCFYAF